MKLDILFHYEVDEMTGEMKFIGQEEVAVDTAALTKKCATKPAKVEDSDEPLIRLDSNKLVLTTGAVQCMNICADCRIDIKYKRRGNVAVPVIGFDKLPYDIPYEYIYRDDLDLQRIETLLKEQEEI